VNLEDADSILNAVGRKFYPADLDKLEMIRGIVLCGDWYRQAIYYGTKKSERQRERTLALISKAAKRLEQLLAEDDAQKLYVGDSLTALLSKDGHDAKQMLRRLFNEAERNLKSRTIKNGPTAAYRESFRKWSPFEWIVGRWLPLVYMELKMHDPGSIEALVAKDSPLHSLRHGVARRTEDHKIVQTIFARIGN
jgi:hypothetical protein